MENGTTKLDALRAQNAELQTRLEEAEEMLRAIRAGEIDALVVGEQLYTLQGVDAEASRFREEVLAQVGDAVVALDNHQRITYLNRAAERQYQVQADEMLGRIVTELFPRSAAKDDARAQVLLKTGQWREEVIHTKRNGETFSVEISASLLRETDGSLSGELLVIRDISERKRGEESLRDSQERLQAALDGSGAGTFRWNIQTDSLEADENLIALFGLPPAQSVVTLDDLIAIVHADDRTGFAEHCQRCARESSDLEIEVRVVWPDGAIHWLTHKGKTFLDEAGKPHYVAGMCIDVTDRKLIEDELTRFNRVAVGRELRMIELKREINALYQRLNQATRYPLEFEKKDKERGFYHNHQDQEPK